MSPEKAPPMAQIKVAPFKAPAPMRAVGGSMFLAISLAKSNFADRPHQTVGKPHQHATPDCCHNACENAQWRLGAHPRIVKPPASPRGGAHRCRKDGEFWPDRGTTNADKERAATHNILSSSSLLPHPTAAALRPCTTRTTHTWLTCIIGHISWRNIPPDVALPKGMTTNGVSPTVPHIISSTAPQL